jgi:citrate lyase beta subunit
MQSYQFIKYDDKTNAEHIKKYAETSAVICFDFKDSITGELKDHYRNCFSRIVKNIIPSVPGIKISLRVNGNPAALRKDLNTIESCRINYVIVPKIEKPEQVNHFQNLLDEKNVLYDEIIPIIETKDGLSNISEIIDNAPQKIKKIAFGHCDYNQSIRAFPFFHQNSLEYWKWIYKLHSVLTPRGITIINSVYLELENYAFFQSMLHHLYEIFGDDCGQGSLTNNQSILIRDFNPENNHQPFEKLVRHRLDLRVPLNYDSIIIEEFESSNKKKCFSIVHKNELLISPHEYQDAKAYYNSKKSKSINFTFVGGCFPVQQNILFEDMFHQKLKRKIEQSYNIEFNINIIRYEQLNTCLDKIKNYNKSYPINLLVFHVRPEPYLRLIKFYYKYMNKEGKRKHSLNIPLLKIMNSEKYDILINERRFDFDANRQETGLHKILVDMNYKVGNICGNKSYALSKYFNVVSTILDYCNDSNIKLIVLGGVSRLNTSYEPKLCEELNDYFKNNLNNRAAYIECLDKNMNCHESYFQSGGIYATEYVHEMVANKLFKEVVMSSL